LGCLLSDQGQGGERLGVGAQRDGGGRPSGRGNCGAQAARCRWSEVAAAGTTLFEIKNEDDKECLHEHSAYVKNSFQ
jgi:hypothetical protein